MHDFDTNSYAGSKMAASFSQGIRWRFSRISSHKLKKTVCRHQHTSVSYIETDDVAEYPPVKPHFPEGKYWGDMPSRVAWIWEEDKQEVAKIKTAQGKIDHLTKRPFRTWTFPVVQVQPLRLDYQQNITKTHLAGGLPHLYKTLDVSKDVDVCKSVLIETIELENSIDREKLIKKQAKPHMTDYNVRHTLVKEIISNLYFNLMGSHEHLLNSQFDDFVKVETYWDRHGIKRYPPKERKPYSDFHLQNNSRFQSINNVNFQIRSEKPLPEVNI